MFLSAPFGFGGGRGANLAGVPGSVFGSVVDNIQPYRDVYSYVTLNADGTASTTRSLIPGGVGTVPFAWFPQSPGIGSFYWVRFTAVRGSVTPNYGVAAGPTLYQLGASRSIGLYVQGGVQGYRWTDVRIDLFASAGGGAVLDSATIRIEAEFLH